MAHYLKDVSHTFSEFLLIPGYTDENCIISNVDLSVYITKYSNDDSYKALKINLPLVSAIMQSVSDDKLAIALAKEGGLSFIYGAQSIEDQAEMVRKVKSHKAGFVVSDSTVKADDTLQDVLDLLAVTHHSTMAVTENGLSDGKLLGVVTSRDYRIGRTPLDTKVKDFMTPFDKLVYGKEGITLSEANDIIWDHKLNALPIVDENNHMVCFVFRKDYDSHKANPNEVLDKHKRYLVGAGINSRDYKERVPALIEAGADVLCIDSSEGYSVWQKNTLKWIRDNYGDSVKVGAGNVVDRDAFNFLADAGADFVKIGIGGGSICITREQKGIGRGQATAVIEVAKARDEYFEKMA